ncbi:MAG: energy transducer TonB [Acidobacteriota bacterium]
MLRLTCPSAARAATRWTIWIVLCFAWSFVAPAFAAEPTQGTDTECRLVEAGRDLAWSGDLRGARDRLEAAAVAGGPCGFEAEAALVGVYRRLGKDRDARRLGEELLLRSGEAQTLAEVSYQLGMLRAERARRSKKAFAEVEPHLVRAIELSGGDHEQAVRELMRLYEATDREAELAELQAAHPEVSAISRGRALALLREGVVLDDERRARAERARKRAEREARGEALPEQPWPPGDDPPDDGLPVFAEPIRRDAWSDVPEGYTAPVPQRLDTPDYSQAARDARYQGEARLMLRIDDRGEPKETVLFERLRMGLSEAAQDAALRSQWTPAKDDEGRAVESWVELIFVFQL